MPLLGNVVISKKFLHTRKIMVMHSNEKGECCLRILVDHSRKRYINTFGSVTSSPSRSSKRGEVVDEFRQHDGVVTVLVKNNLRRASPKHYENYDGG